MRLTTLFTLVTLGCLAAPVNAQWLNHPARDIPRTADGKPNLAAAAPRTPDGKPDFSGIWTTEGTPPAEMLKLFPGIGDIVVPGDDPTRLNKYFVSVFAGIRPEDAPLRPEAMKIVQARLAKGLGTDAPTSRCLPAGVPMGDLIPSPRRFIQTSDLLVITYEGINPTRTIHLDGRPLPSSPNPAWVGYSIGKWDGDTLVVETTGFTEQSWLDGAGNPRSENLRITERMTRADFGHMQTQVTFEDATLYTRPFSISYSQTLRPDTDLLEYVCNENELDRAHIATSR